MGNVSIFIPRYLDAPQYSSCRWRHMRYLEFQRVDVEQCRKHAGGQSPVGLIAEEPSEPRIRAGLLATQKVQMTP